MGWTAIDATWWFGGNRRRGVGEYLFAYFQSHCHVPRTQRKWIVPPTATDNDCLELSQALGGAVLKFSSQISKKSWVQKLKQEGCSQVFFPSPFERPTSLFSLWPLFALEGIRGEAIIFDLLPAQFPQEILALWPQSEQIQYRDWLKQLPTLDFLWCISPATLKGVVESGVDRKKTKVLTFGLKPSWIVIPSVLQSDLPERDERIVLTISGGEWRKNLEGTIEFFLQNFSSSHRLIVICKLGKKHRLQLYKKLFFKGALGRVKLLGEVSDEVKWRWLFTAHDFLFLSRAEGLGIPLLEAEKAQVPQIYVSSLLVQQGLGSLVRSPKVVPVS